MADDFGWAVAEALGVTLGVAFAEVLGVAEADADGEAISDGDGWGLTKITRVSDCPSGKGETVFCRAARATATKPTTKRSTAPIDPNTTNSFFRLLGAVVLELTPTSFSMCTTLYMGYANKGRKDGFTTRFLAWSTRRSHNQDSARSRKKFSPFSFS